MRYEHYTTGPNHPHRALPFLPSLLSTLLLLTSFSTPSTAQSQSNTPPPPRAFHNAVPAPDNTGVYFFGGYEPAPGGGAQLNVIASNTVVRLGYRRGQGGDGGLNSNGGAMGLETVPVGGAVVGPRVSRHSCAMVGDGMYCVFGVLDNFIQPLPADITNTTTQSQFLHIFNTTTNQWSSPSLITVPSFTSATMTLSDLLPWGDSSIVSINSKLYVYGGRRVRLLTTSPPSLRVDTLSTFLAYDIQTREWSFAPNPETNRPEPLPLSLQAADAKHQLGLHASVAMNGKLYVLFGDCVDVDIQFDNGQVVGGGTTAGGRVVAGVDIDASNSTVAVGGSAGSGVVAATNTNAGICQTQNGMVRIFDPSTNRWSFAVPEGTTAPPPMKDVQCVPVPSQNKIYCWGGMRITTGVTQPLQTPLDATFTLDPAAAGGANQQPVMTSNMMILTVTESGSGAPKISWEIRAPEQGSKTPSPRLHHSLTMLGDSWGLVLWGGMEAQSHSGNASTTASANSAGHSISLTPPMYYNIRTNTWSDTPPNRNDLDIENAAGANPRGNETVNGLDDKKGASGSGEADSLLKRPEVLFGIAGAVALVVLVFAWWFISRGCGAGGKDDSGQKLEAGFNNNLATSQSASGSLKRSETVATVASRASSTAPLNPKSSRPSMIRPPTIKDNTKPSPNSPPTPPAPFEPHHSLPRSQHQSLKSTPPTTFQRISQALSDITSRTSLMFTSNIPASHSTDAVQAPPRTITKDSKDVEEKLQLYAKEYPGVRVGTLERNWQTQISRSNTPTPIPTPPQHLRIVNPDSYPEPEYPPSLPPSPTLPPSRAAAFGTAGSNVSSLTMRKNVMGVYNIRVENVTNRDSELFVQRGDRVAILQPASSPHSPHQVASPRCEVMRIGDFKRGRVPLRCIDVGGEDVRDATLERGMGKTKDG
ncbi:hypothetical protein HK102_000690, partial [Quaeritorhiza haematococci]